MKIHEHKKSPTVQGLVTTNDGNLAIIAMPAPSVETLRIVRFFNEEESHFKAQWAVGKSVTVEGRK